MTENEKKLHDLEISENLSNIQTQIAILARYLQDGDPKGTSDLVQAKSLLGYAQKRILTRNNII